jgi:allantoinase
VAELVIRNARLVLQRGIIEGGLAIANGRITKIAKTGLPRGDREIDAGSRVVMPGVIDAHTHLYDPRFTHREDFRSGTKAAAAGGVTSVIVMPLDTPVLTSQQIRKTIAVGRKQSFIDFALHAGNMTIEAIKNVHAITRLGIRSFKVFTCAPYGDYVATVNVMRTVKDVGGVTFVHAEDEEVMQNRIKRLRAAGRKDPIAHAESRPNLAEARAMERVIELARQIGCRLHLAHVTTRQGVELVKQAKRVHITAETCPHYLIFSKGDMRKQGPYLRVNPALKTKADCAALWRALANGTIDIVATDHAPGTREEKEVGWRNIWKAQIGIPGIETLLPLMLSEGIARKRLTLLRLVDALCARPAQIFGLYPRKGIIRVGSDGDLVVVDLKKRVTISAEKLHYKVGWTPYEGIEVKGVPVMTISRGIVISEEGDVIGKRGRGQYLARGCE